MALIGDTRICDAMNTVAPQVEYPPELDEPLDGEDPSEILHASAILGMAAFKMVNACRWDGLNLSLLPKRPALLR